MNPYTHRFDDDGLFHFVPGKVVCVGRNYADHAKELGNEIPESPLLFIKPSTSLVPFAEPIRLPQGQGTCHHELEIALLIGEPLCQSQPEACLQAVAGYGLALDLTLRELQQQLKDKGHPWERAKAFDGACPLSVFISAEDVDIGKESLSLYRNGERQQYGECRDMLFSVPDLLAEISRSFTLLPGDVVLTGTPAGVGELKPGDKLRAELGEHLTIETCVAD